MRPLSHCFSKRTEHNRLHKGSIVLLTVVDCLHSGRGHWVYGVVANKAATSFLTPPGGRKSQQILVFPLYCLHHSLPLQRERRKRESVRERERLESTRRVLQRVRLLHGLVISKKQQEWEVVEPFSSLCMLWTLWWEGPNNSETTTLILSFSLSLFLPLSHLHLSLTAALLWITAFSPCWRRLWGIERRLCKED